MLILIVKCGCYRNKETNKLIQEAEELIML